MMVRSFVLFLFACSVAAAFDNGAIPTTTRVYELQVPGSDSIKIIETDPDPLSSSKYREEADKYNNEKHGSQHYKVRANFGINSDTYNKDTQALKNFLNTYSKNFNNKKTEEVPNRENAETKSKSWDMLEIKRHHHPYDDKKGWVTLEPVPWSVSKVSKWQTNKDQWEDQYESNDYNPNPYHSHHHHHHQYNHHQKPSYHNNDDNDYYYNKKQHQQNIHVEQTNYDNYPNSWKKPNRYQNRNHQKNEDYDDSGEIITDGLPPNFPNQNRRRGTETQRHSLPDSHPFNSQGDWVLVSTTRGYKYPKNRERSLQMPTESVGAHRTVRLTVLPPLKGSNINMTTSHGGMLQVEQTFETVEQSQKAHAKKQQKQKIKRQKITNYVAPTTSAATATKLVKGKSSATDTSAVLAAVGAGMIPATMAMLVPMALSGGRRRKRDIPNTHIFKILAPK